MKKNPNTLLRKWATEKPDEPAVYFKEWLSYREFDLLVGRFARHLINLGVKENQGISLYFDHSLESLALIYGINRIGAYFIPFNKHQSPKTIEELTNETELKSIFCLQSDAHKFLCPNVIGLDEIQRLEPYQKIVEGALAYQIHTSGTTGKPKGVLISNKNLDYVFQFIDDNFSCNENDTLIWNTPYTFDVSIVEIFGWVLNGGKIAIQNSDEIRALNRLAQFLLKHKVTHLNLSPTILASLMDFWNPVDLQDLNKQLKYLLIAGEAFPLELAKYSKKMLADVRILNLYGPTEASVYATAYEVKGNEKAILPIGKELRGVTIKMLDQQRQEVEQGQIGELTIFGDGVAVGYSNNPEETKQKFASLNGERFYSTGDFARRLPSNDIEFLGRKDRQVQVNGIRVELSSIESKMDEFFNHPGSVKVLFHEGRLHLFYTNKDANKEALKQFCQEHLNTYETPSTFNSIDEFPLTPNRKLDEKTLLANLTSSSDSKRPLNSHQDNSILNLILEIFELNKNQRDSAFSDLGLDSLSTLMGMAKIEREFKIQLTEDLFLGMATPSELAKEIAKKIESTGRERNNGYLNLRENIDHQVENWKNLGIYYFSNEKVKLHRTGGLQKIYYHDNFESALLIKIKISRKYSHQQVLTAIRSLINEVQALRLAIEEKNEDLLFIELPQKLVYNIPFLAVDAESSSLKNELDLLCDSLIARDQKIYQKNYLYTPVILEFQNEFLILFTMSHLISDGSSEFVLKKLLIDLLDKKACTSPPYTQFIEFIEKKTDANKILGLEHSKQLLALGKIQNVEFSFNATIPKRTYQIDPDKTLEEKIGYLCFQLCREYSESMNVRSLPISTILNLRNFEGFDAALVVGDVHSTVVTYFLSTDTLEEFNNRLKNIIAEYLRGNNPYQAAFSSFPKSDDIQQTLEMIYDTNPLISLNYLGYIDDSNLSEQLQNLEKTKNILQAFPATRVYLTAFENSKNEIRVYALNEVSKK